MDKKEYRSVYTWMCGNRICRPIWKLQSKQWKNNSPVHPCTCCSDCLLDCHAVITVIHWSDVFTHCHLLPNILTALFHLLYHSRVHNVWKSAVIDAMPCLLTLTLCVLFMCFYVIVWYLLIVGMISVESSVLPLQRWPLELGWMHGEYTAVWAVPRRMRYIHAVYT